MQPSSASSRNRLLRISPWLMWQLLRSRNAGGSMAGHAWPHLPVTTELLQASLTNPPQASSSQPPLGLASTSKIIAAVHELSSSLLKRYDSLHPLPEPLLTEHQAPLKGGDLGSERSRKSRGCVLEIFRLARVSFPDRYVCPKAHFMGSSTRAPVVVHPIRPVRPI